MPAFYTFFYDLGAATWYLSRESVRHFRFYIWLKWNGVNEILDGFFLYYILVSQYVTLAKPFMNAYHNSNLLILKRNY